MTAPRVISRPYSSAKWLYFTGHAKKLNKSKCFPLFTQQRTSPRYFGMSVSWLTLFDHLVGDGKKARLQFQIERAGGFQIH